MGRPKQEAATRFAIVSGIRYDEAKNLRWTDIEADRIMVNSAKTFKTRYVRINPEMAEILGGLVKNSGQSGIDKVFISH